MSYNLEDISENINDGFEWYSVIDNMDFYRVQVATSSNGAKYVLHVYNSNDESVDNEAIVEYVEQTLNAEEDTSDEYKPENK